MIVAVLGCFIYTTYSHNWLLNNVYGHIRCIQAEAGELARKVESLNSENVTLKSEISWLTENSEKLRVENATLMVLL